MITYQLEPNLSPNEFKDVLVKSTLSERRPIDDSERIKAMVDNANLIITARDNDKLVGVSRSITDFVYCTYLSDLAVDETYQKLGIGKELIRLTKKETPQATLILLAAPAAEHYYPHIGMTKTDVCFLLKDINDLK
ncbi:GNAT family N-acetyltransferase [Winogradskyella psychrotolerans]|uniref:GNAT family N-acetyltransferase n=1 Tax=Winogradskyella psychrotolerans TaxID=1344585 RepID=UPI001C06F50A|nr:GNAT family N-acetyltransferase [Winogradskyella psychrotolerans]MBU2930247.1 GNAT family N-acetyltransferase [Winogradskyella psychrotolerans]